MSEQNIHEDIARWLNLPSKATMFTLSPKDASDLLDEWEDAQAMIARLRAEMTAIKVAMWAIGHPYVPESPAWTVIA